jgi:uroporphyrinogen-III synthase
MITGLRIIVTRPRPDAEFTALKLKDIGQVPLIAPTLQFVPLAITLPDPSKLSGLVATSSNALRALSERGDIEQFKHLHAFVVGDATAETARAFGFERVTSAEGTATELAMLLRKVAEPQRLLYVHGRDRAADLVAMVATARHLIISSPVYEMRPITELPSSVILAIDGGAVDAALFYSRRAAGFFADAARKATIAGTDLACLCLSEEIAETLRNRGFHRCFAAVRPTEAALFELLATFSTAEISP